MSVRDDLQLDLTDALSGLTDLADRLDEITSGFQTGLTEALAVFASGQTVEVTAEADTTRLVADVEEAIADIPDVEVDATANTDGVTDALADLTASTPTVEVDVGADITSAETAISGIEADGVELSVEVDTEDADSAIQGLAVNADTAAGAASSLAESLSSVAAGADITGSSVADLTKQLTEHVPVVGAVVASLVGAAIAGSSFATKAIEADQATARFQATFRGLGDEVEDVNIAGLNTSLGTLVRTLGSGATEVRNNLASFAQLGDAAGASAERVATASEQLLVLASRSVALNPALGSVGAVVDSLSTALARGGRFTADYGISLTTAEIQNRAFLDTGKQSVEQLTQFDKAAAGAAVATEKYGASLQAIIAAASGNPILQLRALQATLSATSTELGRPLVAPLFDLLQTAQPIFLNAITLVGTLARTALPVLTSALTAVAPAISTTTVALSGLLTSLGPSVARLATSAGQVIAPILDLVASLIPAVQPFVDGLATIVTGVAGVIDALGPFPVALAAAAAGMVALGITSIPALVSALETLYLVMLSHPVLIFAAALAGIVGLIVKSREETEGAARGQEQFRSALFGTATTLEETKAKLEELNRSAATYIATQSEFAKTGTVASLIEVGLSAAEVTKQLERGATGANTLIERLVAAGKVRLSLDGVNQSADDVRDLGRSLDSLITSGQISVDQGRDLVAAIQAEASARNGAAQAQLQTLRLTGQLTEARYQEIVALVNSVGHTGSYSEALAIATGTQTTTARSAEQLATSLGAITPEVTKAEQGLTGLIDAEQAYVDSKQEIIQANKDHEEAERAVADAERGVIEASRGVTEAQRGLQTAIRAVEDAHRGEEAAQRAVESARQRQIETLRAVDDATRGVIEAQTALNDALAGPSADEQLAIDSARVALRRAELRIAKEQADLTSIPGVSAEEAERLRLLGDQREAEEKLLDQQEAGISLRRAQADLTRAEAANSERQRTAAESLADAQERLLEARRQVAPASLAVVEAERGVTDAAVRTRDAQFGVEGATLRVRDAELAVDEARRGTEDARARLVESELGIGAARDASARAAFALDAAQRALNAALTESPGSIDGAIAHLEALKLKYPELSNELQNYIDRFRGFAPTVAEQGGQDAGTAFVGGANRAITDPATGIGSTTRDGTSRELLSIDWESTGAVDGALRWVDLAIAGLTPRLGGLDVKLREWAGTVAGTILRGIGDLSELLVGKGVELVNGLFKGMMDAIKGPLVAFKDGFVEQLGQAFKTGSPARVMFPLGRNITAGVVAGMVESGSGVVAAAEAIAREAANAQAGALNLDTAKGLSLAGGTTIGTVAFNVDVAITGPVDEVTAQQVGQQIAVSANQSLQQLQAAVVAA